MVQSVPIQFDIPSTDIIPQVASVRATCSITVSGEDLWLMNNEKDLTTLEAEPGTCSIVLHILGTDVVLPVANTTPLGRHAFFLPAVATLTFAVVDISIDLMASLNATPRVMLEEAASVSPTNLTWTAWGARRLLVEAADGRGGVLNAQLESPFTYTMALMNGARIGIAAQSLSLTVYALNVIAYQRELTQIGSFAGDAALRTSLVVDLLPHAPLLEMPRDVTHEGARFSWEGASDDDLARLELWISDGNQEVAYIVDDVGATSLRVPTRSNTAYSAWLVAVDASGQRSASQPVGFHTPASPADLEAAQARDAVMWTTVGVVIVAALVGYAFGHLRGRGLD